MFPHLFKPTSLKKSTTWFSKGNQFPLALLRTIHNYQTQTHPSLPPLQSDAFITELILKSNSETLNLTLESHNFQWSPNLVDRVLKRLWNDGPKALQFFKYLDRHPTYKHSTSSYDHAIDISGRLREYKTLWTLVYRMRSRRIGPTPKTFAIITERYVAAGKADRAVKVFMSMHEHGCPQDLHSFNTFLDVLCDVTKARKVFNQMIKEGCLPSVPTYNAFIQVLCKKDTVENALVVFEEMVRKGYVPNATTYAVVIRGLCHAGKIDAAMERMKDDECEPNVQTYNVIIRYLCEAGELEKALEVFEKMCRGDCLPILDTYNILISAMFVRQKPDDLLVAGKLLVEMVDKGFIPRRFTFNRVLNGLLLTGNQVFAKEILRAQSLCGRLPREFKL